MAHMEMIWNYVRMSRIIWVMFNFETDLSGHRKTANNVFCLTLVVTPTLRCNPDPKIFSNMTSISATLVLFQQDSSRFSNMISISARLVSFQQHSSFFSNIFLTSATFSSFQQLRISATFSATWVYPEFWSDLHRNQRFFLVNAYFLTLAIVTIVSSVMVSLGSQSLELHWGRTICWKLQKVENLITYRNADFHNLHRSAFNLHQPAFILHRCQKSAFRYFRLQSDSMYRNVDF